MPAARNRRSAVGVLSSMAIRPLLPATSEWAGAASICVFIGASPVCFSAKSTPQFRRSHSVRRCVGPPLPVADFGHVLAVRVDVLAMLDEFVTQRLFQVRSHRPELRQSIDGVSGKVKPI